MPKGVEHDYVTASSGIYRAVKESVMPKGVEHSLEKTMCAGSRSVKESVMPKGVEHVSVRLRAARTSAGEGICDAERR